MKINPEKRGQKVSRLTGVFQKRGRITISRRTGGYSKKNPMITAKKG